MIEEPPPPLFFTKHVLMVPFTHMLYELELERVPSRTSLGTQETLRIQSTFEKPNCVMIVLFTHKLHEKLFQAETPQEARNPFEETLRTTFSKSIPLLLFRSKLLQDIVPSKSQEPLIVNRTFVEPFISNSVLMVQCTHEIYMKLRTFNYQKNT